MILKYLQFKYKLIPVCKQNVTYSIRPMDATGWDGLVDGEIVRSFATEDEGRKWLEKIKTAIDGGDIITIIDDF